MTLQDVLDEMSERGTFWWVVHKLNGFPIPDWLFLAMMIAVLITFVVGASVATSDLRRDRDS